jgi:hypothetical protein
LFTSETGNRLNKAAAHRTFRLLLKLTRKRLRKPPDRIAFEDIDAP